MRMNKQQIKMVEEFVCPGCVIGGNTKCGKFEPITEYGAGCAAHVLGTAIGAPNNLVALGLPKGFNKPGSVDRITPKKKMDIRLWEMGQQPEWDHLNIPVWAMEQGVYLFVRTYSPRRSHGYVDVIEGGTLAMVPNAINVGEFIDEID